MKISRYAKSIIYQIISVILLAVSAYFNLSMQTESGLETAYFKSNTYLFFAAAVLMGIGIYSYRSYSRHHREHLADYVIFIVTGIILMVINIIVLVAFGGLDNQFEKSGYVAANLNIIVLSVLPLPFYVRGFLLAVRRSDINNRSRFAAIIISIIMTGAYITLFSIGGIFKFVHYQESYTLSNSYADETEFSN